MEDSWDKCDEPVFHGEWERRIRPCEEVEPDEDAHPGLCMRGTMDQCSGNG